MTFPYVGDFSLEDPVQIFFNTRNFTTFAPTTLLGTPAAVVYLQNDANEIAAVNLFVDHDGRVGLNRVGFFLSAASGYIAGTYHVVLTAGTVGGVSVAGQIIGGFSISNRSRDIIARLPAALIGGRMDSHVGAMAADTLNASALAADAGLEIRTGLATTGDVTGLATAAALANVQQDTFDIKNRIPLFLNGGRMESHIGSASIEAILAIQQGLARTNDLDELPTNAELAAALEVIATATEVADAILRRNVAGGSDGVRTVSEALYVLRNKTEIIGGFMKVYQTDDATVAFQGPVTTAPGDPLTSFDPA